MRTLQDMLEALPLESLPPSWLAVDLAAFSQTKRLWDYQQEALTCALKALWTYYGDFGDYCASEAPACDAPRKERLFQWYNDNDLGTGLDIPLDSARRDIRHLLEAYYTPENGHIPYEHFINRIGFWMATGSGKTLVLVKLIELLWWLIRQKQIPPHDILVLTCRDDLLDQFKAHVDEFNGAHGDLFIRLHELKEYPEVKRGNLSLFGDREIAVFYYRSDNLSDEQKERIIDFRNYDDHGRWYILLDEAHKGDKEDSKRQHIYSILSRNGFLFNFSATFTDPRDVVTTAYDFNLARFVEAGYGKHISILKQENRAFKDKEDFTGEEKQKVVLKALMALAYAHQAHLSLRGPGGNGRLYHRPLLLTLVNSVNTEDADLKLFFRELERIGRGGLSPDLWEQARKELWQELGAGPELLFEGERFLACRDTFDTVTPEVVLRSVYNAPGPGDMEVWVRPSNRQELAFKLKNADRPFALIKIGDVSEWLKQELSGYTVLEGFQDEGFFQRLNAEDSDINILMGSRSFYEGWDSNRPNVVTFINIGTGTDARKFILQSVGRGVRIEPLPGHRKRLHPLYNAGLVSPELYRSLRQDARPLETLFIFGTNRQALQAVIEQLDQEGGKQAVHELALEVNRNAVDDHLLLVPVYRSTTEPLLSQRAPRKFEVAPDELELLCRYRRHLRDDRLLLARHGIAPRHLGLVERCLASPANYFNTHDGRRYGDLGLLLRRLSSYFDLVPEEFHGLKPLEDEICHFRHIKVFLKDISALRQEIERVRQYPQRAQQQAELQRRYEAQQLPFDELLQEIDKLNRLVKESGVTYQANTLEVRHVANHYYVPMILSHDEKADYIRHVVRHPSEIRFIHELDAYLERPGNRFHDFDWWLFSKLDEALDQVYIPYYDPNTNAVRRFNPDFIFWSQRGGDSYILFVDPKGMQQSGYQHKIEGYRALFEDPSGGLRVFSHEGLSVRIGLRLYTVDVNQVPPGYRRFWCDRPEALFDVFQ